jgi:general secretion pathway protein A
MYESYWQLQHKPFESGVDRRFYYPGESQQAALLKLRYAIESRHSGAILAGPSGSGKTMAVEMLKTMLGEEFSPLVHLVFPQLNTAELLDYLADELSGAGGGSNAAESVRRIERFLIENAQAGRHAVVFIDEAQLLDDPATLETLRLLLNFQFDGQPAMTLVLAGQTGLLPILDRAQTLEERLAVKCLIRPFTPDETASYVEHRLRVAGAQRPIFEPSSLTTLHSLTRGIPRRINRLCDLSLLIAYAEGHRTIAASLLESISQELVSVVPE